MEEIREPDAWLARVIDHAPVRSAQIHRLVPEVANPGKDHRHPGGVRGGDHVVVAYLNRPVESRQSLQLESLPRDHPQRKKCVACENAPSAHSPAFFDRDPDALNSVGLTAPTPTTRSIFASTIAFDLTWRATSQANRRSTHSSLVGARLVTTSKSIRRRALVSCPERGTRQEMAGRQNLGRRLAVARKRQSEAA